MATICNTAVNEGTYGGACAAAIMRHIGIPARLAEKFATATAVAFTSHGPSIFFIHAGEAWPAGELHTQEHRTSRGTVFLNRGWRTPASTLAEWPACVERPAETPVVIPATEVQSGDAPECVAVSLTIGNDNPTPTETGVVTPVSQEALLADTAKAMSDVLGRHGAPNAQGELPQVALVVDASTTEAVKPASIDETPPEPISSPADVGCGIEDLVEEESPPAPAVKTLVPGWVPADSLEDPGLFEPGSPEARQEVKHLQRFLRGTRDAGTRREISEAIDRLAGKAK